MRRNVPMRFKHLLAFIPLTLVGMCVVSCDGGQSESSEEWDVRLNGTGSRCSGWLEMLHTGKWKRISSKNWTQQNAELACKQLHCGFPVGILKPYSEEPEKQEIGLVECRGNETALKDCIRHEYNGTHHLSVALVCQDPKQTSTVPQPTTATLVTLSKPSDTPRIRLENRTSLCSGTAEPNFGGQESKPGVSSAETVLGILLGLVLTTVLLILCVPPTYKKMVKKYSKKRQHQWIGPSGVNQNVSFHRNSSVAFQSRPESQVVQEENKAFKKNSHLSPYAALERGNNRSSSPLDNSSDSDYDLSSARQV